jgi:anti-sigma factor RsiW
MTHPEELLAPYVDGTASPQEREAVDAHVSSCARCRAEIDAATVGRAALRGLPVVDAPAGLAPELARGDEARPVRGTAGGAPGQTPGQTPSWYRWAGAASAAAMIALLLALVVPHLGNDTEGSTRAGAPLAAATSGPMKLVDGHVALEIQSQNYADDSLKDLLTAQAAAAPEATNALASGVTSADVTTLKGTSRQTLTAEACIRQAFERVPGHLVRLIAANYAGARAYIGIYEQSTGSSRTPDTVVGRVASVDSCTILTLLQARRAA